MNRAPFFVGKRSEISNFLRKDFNRIIECEFTFSNPRLEREGE